MKRYAVTLLIEGYPRIKENVPGFTGIYAGLAGMKAFDLSQFAGQKGISLLFRYLTDWASNESGWFIDNIEIPEIGYEQ